MKDEILRIHPREGVEIKDVGEAPALRIGYIEELIKKGGLEEIIKEGVANPDYWLLKLYLNPNWYKRNWAVFTKDGNKIFPYTDNDPRLIGYTKDNCEEFINKNCYKCNESYFFCNEIGGNPERYMPWEIELIPTEKKGKDSISIGQNSSTKKHEFYEFKFPLYVIKARGEILVPDDHFYDPKRYKEYLRGEKESFLRWKLQQLKSSNLEDKVFSKGILKKVILLEPFEELNRYKTFVLLDVQEESHIIFKDEKDDKTYKCNFAWRDRGEGNVSFSYRAHFVVGNISQNWMLCKRVYPHKEKIEITKFKDVPTVKGGRKHSKWE